MNKKWRVRSSQDLLTAGFFKLRVDSCDLPDGRHMPRYYVIEFPAWIHVVATTRDEQIIVVRQYRHGAGLDFLELPGGSLDPNSGETPLMAAQRELREETGYTSNSWQLILEHFPNPALQNNKMYTFWAKNCELTHTPEWDAFEDIIVEKHSIAALYEQLARGEINHSLMLGSLAVARQHLCR